MVWAVKLYQYGGIGTWTKGDGELIATFEDHEDVLACLGGDQASTEDGVYVATEESNEKYRG